MNLQENIQRIRSMMGLLTEEEQKSYENKPIILIGPQGTGKSTTAKSLAEKLGIDLISTDMSMVDEKYENMCKDELGVEVEIKRHPTEGLYYDSNDEYVFCVLNKLMDEYGNKKIVLDVGATHAYISEELSSEVKELFNQSPNVFIFNVSGDKDKTYEFLKKRREGRGEETKDEDDKKFRTAINNLNNYYRGTQKISIIDKDKKSKTTDELVDEIITKLT
jgi:adenylate kinase family enzyme